MCYVPLPLVKSHVCSVAPKFRPEAKKRQAAGTVTDKLELPRATCWDMWCVGDITWAVTSWPLFFAVYRGWNTTQLYRNDKPS